MFVDIHVHTNRYSECGRSSPEEMLQRALDLGLNGLVLTEHNILWPLDELAELQAKFPTLALFRGVEMTVEGGDHMLVYGVLDPSVLVENMAPYDLVDTVHRLGGTVVLAHPYRYNPTLPPSLDDCPVDAIEICSKNTLNYAHAPAVALCEQRGVPATVASDGHHIDNLGIYAMGFEWGPIRDESDLALAIRRGEYGLYADALRLTAWNDALLGVTTQVRHYIDEGLDDRAIREAMGDITYTTIRGVRNRRDVGFPLHLADAESDALTHLTASAPWARLECPVVRPHAELVAREEI